MKTSEPTVLLLERVVLVARLWPLDCLSQFPWRPVAAEVRSTNLKPFSVSPPSWSLQGLASDLASDLASELVVDVQEVMPVTNCFWMVG